MIREFPESPPDNGQNSEKKGVPETQTQISDLEIEGGVNARGILLMSVIIIILVVNDLYYIYSVKRKILIQKYFPNTDNPTQKLRTFRIVTSGVDPSFP